MQELGLEGGGVRPGRSTLLHMQRPGLKADHARQGCYTCQHLWDLGLGPGLGREPGELHCLAAAPIEAQRVRAGGRQGCSTYVLGLGMGQVGQVIAPAGTYKSWDRVYAMPSWARLQHLPVTAGGPTSTCKTQDLVGELWGSPCCATPPNDMCESQD